MKKIFIIVILFIGISHIASAQNVVIQSNTNTSQSNVDSNQYYINGISTREDIGGVDVQFEEDYSSNSGGYTFCTLIFTNYHSVPVRVIYELPRGYNGKTYGAIMLKAYETKKSPRYKLDYKDNSIIMIVRKF